MQNDMLRTAHWLGCLPVLLAFVVGPAHAADVVEIEEHWQLTVGGPDHGRSSPQISMIMSPRPDVDGNFFAITLNHASYPTFAPGGVQVQHWHGDSCLSAKSSEATSPLWHNDETVTWVQRLRLDAGVLTFEVADGASTSWGAFGSEGELRLSTPTELVRLNNYKPGVSITESGISFAGNRVSSLVLTKLRAKTSDGQVYEKVAPIDIDTDIDP